jgi:hypothetical protein
MRPDEAFGSFRSGSAGASCPVVSNPARLSSIHTGQSCFGNNAVEVGGGGGGVHSVLVNRSISGNSSLTVGASPAVKAAGPLSSLTGLISSDTPPREAYAQRVQVTVYSLLLLSVTVTCIIRRVLNLACGLTVPLYTCHIFVMISYSFCISFIFSPVFWQVCLWASI